MTVSKKIKQRVKKLRETIDDYRYRYHVLDDPRVSDAVYDSLMQELSQLEKKYPSLKRLDSPTQRIGGKPLAKFKKVKHRLKQWSLSDAFSLVELQEWEERNLKIIKKKVLAKKELQKIIKKMKEYVVELKIDGLKIILEYKNGLLVQGATRGDGAIGEDVTANIRTIQSIPLHLPQPLTLTVVGECWLSEQELQRLNSLRRKKGEVELANSRNAAAGSIRQLDSKIAASRKLDSFIYDLNWLKPKQFFNQQEVKFPATQLEELQFLQKLTFKVNKHYKLCYGLKEVQKIFKFWEKKRNKQEYGIDGLVLKINAKFIQDLLGYTGKSPRFAIAYKFPTEKATTVIKDIKLQVGRTGVLTPVAILKPVVIAGSVVAKATLHNEGEIIKKDIRINDTVVVHKAGDVIPEVIEVIKKMRLGKEEIWRMPKNCPMCTGKIKRESVLDNKKKESSAYYCANKDCLAIQREKIIHFVSKKGMNIDGFGKKIVEQLISVGLINSVADIFYLNKAELVDLERFAEKSADNLLKAIRESKVVKLENFLYALGIRYLGEESAYLLVKEIFNPSSKLFFKKKNLQNMKTPQDLEEYFSKIEKEDLLIINGLGEQMVNSILGWFQDNNNKKILQQLNKAKIIFNNKILLATNNILQDKVFVLTGSLPTMTRSVAKKIIKEKGGKVSANVSKKTNFVLVGDRPGSKLQKAKQLKVPVINEEQFKKMII